MSDRRVAWIRAQLDATEATAKWAAEEVGDGRWQQRNVRIVTVADRDREVADYAIVECIDHIVLHDPADALADVEAKRAILEAYADAASTVASMPYPDGRDIGREEALEGVIRLLAEGFRGRPGYEEACGE